jgi:hypothetical protein
VTIAATPKSLVRLTVGSVSVTRGGCVEFSNTTSASVRVSVAGTSYAETVPAKGTTSGSSNFLVTKTVTVNATSGLRSGSGTITAAEASPTSSPSNPPTQTAVPHPSPSTAPATSPSRHRHHHRKRQHHLNRQRHRVKVSLPPLPPLPTDGLITQPRGSNPVVAPGLTTAPAAPTQPASGSDTTGVATVVEPVSGNGRGLPVLIALVLLAGLVAAYARTLLGFAPAVDNRPPRSHRA